MISIRFLPPTMSKIISHTRKLMEHINASSTKYPRLIHYIRETLPELRGNDCVQRFEQSHVLTQCKPVKGLASSYLLSDRDSGITGYGQ
jgi:hypothetical protein